eukprot:SAG31_NODE_46562_length_254_cov_0.632258_1_plen_64_part_10
MAQGCVATQVAVEAERALFAFELIKQRFACLSTKMASDFTKFMYVERARPTLAICAIQGGDLSG